MAAPSEKQIKYAKAIAERLKLDFPKGDCDFNSQAYFNFIAENVKAFKDAKQHDYEMNSYNFTEDDYEMIPDFGYFC